MIRYQKFNPNFASSVQDFRSLQLYSSPEYVFSNFQPRTTEKGILEPNNKLYETNRYDDDFQCDNPCLSNKRSHDYIPRPYGVHHFRQSSHTQRHPNERPYEETNKLGAYTLPRKNINHLKKTKNVTQNYFNCDENLKQPCDNKSPFKITQNEHFSLLSSQPMNYDNAAMHFKNHPLGAFNLIQPLPRAYISESQVLQKSEKMYIKPFAENASSHLQKMEPKPYSKPLSPLNPYKQVLMPFEITESIANHELQRRSILENQRLRLDMEYGYPNSTSQIAERCFDKGPINERVMQENSISNLYRRGSDQQFHQHVNNKRVVNKNIGVGEIYIPPVDVPITKSNDLADDCV